MLDDGKKRGWASEDAEEKGLVEGKTSLERAICLQLVHQFYPLYLAINIGVEVAFVRGVMFGMVQTGLGLKGAIHIWASLAEQQPSNLDGHLRLYTRTDASTDTHVRG